MIFINRKHNALLYIIICSFFLNNCQLNSPKKPHGLNFLDNREKKIKFPQEIFDNIFLSVEYHIREIGYGDVVVNKKMKTLTRIFYDILLKIKSSQNQVFIINNNVLKTYFDVQSNKSDQLVDKLAMYFKDFYYYCFELDNNIVLKGQINFNYTNKNGRT